MNKIKCLITEIANLGVTDVNNIYLPRSMYLENKIKQEETRISPQGKLFTVYLFSAQAMESWDLLPGQKKNVLYFHSNLGTACLLLQQFRQTHIVMVIQAQGTVVERTTENIWTFRG